MNDNKNMNSIIAESINVARYAWVCSPIVLVWSSNHSISRRMWQCCLVCSHLYL